MENNNPTDQINKDAQEWVGTLSVENKAQEYTQEIFDDEAEEKVRYVPTPNFTECGSAGSQLPVNVANETITILSKYRSEFDFVDFIKEKLNFNSKIAVCMAFFSEQIDALVLAIKQFESGKALILGDMAGIGKGRVCAGILRYAYVNKMIPVFITEKENLFSDIYRDIMGIGGFGGSGNYVEPKPFIMNPIKRKRIKQDDGTNKTLTINAITDDNDVVRYEPLTHNEINNLVEGFDGSFPFRKKSSEYKFNSVFLTYNVISKTRGTSGDAKRYFLQSIAKDSIFIFDECHNASGKSKLGEFAKMYVNEAKGVLFSSATFAKNPQAFPLYVIKTAMREAQIDVTTIEDAISVGGENVSEYISSVLVKEGQMIRRERDFRGCTIGTIYDGSNLSGQEAVEAKDRIYDVFDRATEKFRAIYKYIKQQDFVEAINEAILRKSTELGLQLADQKDYVLAKGTSQAKQDAQDDFIKANRNKWVIASKETNTLGSTSKFHFTENILLAIKTKFTADAIIKELRSEVEYTNFDGKKVKSNRKPVIAIRATGENLFNKLNLKSGDAIENDFGVYIRAVVSGVLSGRVIFRKVNTDLFVPSYVLKENNKEHIDEVALYEIDNEDLSDGGARLNALISEVNGFVSGIPLCPIDYMIDRIQSVQRMSTDKFRYNPNYVVGEITGRNYALYKDSNTNLWVYKPNERNRSVKGLFNSFNSGKTDVLIINSSGSTGGSIHSSESFKDQRQRIMFIPQIELNVNTEVQKRGRINRSGQVNYPAYLYILSMIPSEIRKYLSLKKKLRKLDANTSANQTQNSSIVDIRDKNGKPINDIFNIYGERAFDKFLDNDDNWKFKTIYDEMKENKLNTLFEENEVVAGEVEGADLNPFTRELEIHPCDDQEEFYDKMNTLYETVVDEEKNNGTYQLELDIEDLKATLRSRLVRQMNSGATEFSKPLFIEDKYCLDRRKSWGVDKVNSESIKMATKYYTDRKGEFIDLKKYHRDLLEDFEIEFESYIESQINEFISFRQPKREEFMSDESFKTAMDEYDEGYARRTNALRQDKTEIENILRWFSPKRNVVIPDVLPKDTETTVTYRFGKFIGYNFKDSSILNKYSKGSIHLKFAILPKFGDSVSVAPTLELSLGNREGMSMVKEIRQQSDLTFSNTALIGLRTMGEIDNERVNEWKVKVDARRVVRFLSGNILSGIQLANNMYDIKSWCLVKYTNNDGTFSTSLRLDYASGKFKALADEKTQELRELVPIQVSLNNPSIIEYLRLTPPDYVFGVAVNTLRSRTVDSVANGKDIMVRNLIKMGKGKADPNNFYIEIFQISTRKKNENGKFEVFSTPSLNGSDGNNPIFFAQFLNDYKPFAEKTYVKEKDNDTSGFLIESPEFKSERFNGSKRVSGFSRVYRFTNIDTDKGTNELRTFLDKLFGEQDLSLDFPQNINDYYNVAFQTDVFVSKNEKEKDKQSVGIFNVGDYEYKLDVPYDEKYQASKPPDFNRYVKGKDSFDKGSIFLRKPLSPAFARAYNIYPINLGSEDVIKLLLSIFAPDEKEKFIKELTIRAEKGDNANKIGDFVSVTAMKHSVPELKYIFGKMRTGDIGELLKTYALKGDITKLSYETAEEEPQDIVRTRRKKDKVTFEDAEKFVNYLLF